MEPGKLMKTWRHNESVIQGDSAYDIWPGELHRMSCILDDLDAEKCWKMEFGNSASLAMLPLLQDQPPVGCGVLCDACHTAEYQEKLLP